MNKFLFYVVNFLCLVLSGFILNLVISDLSVLYNFFVNNSLLDVIALENLKDLFLVGVILFAKMGVLFLSLLIWKRIITKKIKINLFSKLNKNSEI